MDTFLSAYSTPPTASPTTDNSLDAPVKAALIKHATTVVAKDVATSQVVAKDVSTSHVATSDSVAKDVATSDAVAKHVATSDSVANEADALANDVAAAGAGCNVACVTGDQQLEFVCPANKMVSDNALSQ